MADTPENIEAPAGPTNDTVPSTTYEPNPNANENVNADSGQSAPTDGEFVSTYTEASGDITEQVPGATATSSPTINPETDPFDASYNNPPLSNLQVGITTEGTVIPLDVVEFVAPVNVTDLSSLVSDLYNGLTTNDFTDTKYLNAKYAGFSITLHLGPESYSFKPVYLAYPNYLTYTQVTQLAQQVLQQIQSNPSSFFIKPEYYDKNNVFIHEMLFSQVTGISIMATKFDSLPPNAAAPVYT